jgi:hypothetical protein
MRTAVVPAPSCPLPSPLVFALFSVACDCCASLSNLATGPAVAVPVAALAPLFPAVVAALRGPAGGVTAGEAACTVAAPALALAANLLGIDPSVVSPLQAQILLQSGSDWLKAGDSACVEAALALLWALTACSVVSTADDDNDPCGQWSVGVGAVLSALEAGAVSSAFATVRTLLDACE